MPDLRMSAVHAFWDNYDRNVLYRVIMAIEQVEKPWVVDTHPEVEAALFQLGEAIDQSKEFEISDPKPIIRVLAQVRASRAMRLLQAIEMAQPGTAGFILSQAEELARKTETSQSDKYAKVFLQRNLVFERLQLLSRVFARNRIALILNALEEIELS